MCRARNTGCRTGAQKVGTRTGPRLRHGRRDVIGVSSGGGPTPRPVPTAAQKKRGGGGGVVGRGTAAWGLERTHRRTWTSRPAVKKRDTVKGLSPCISIQGAQGVPPESGPGRAGEGRASGQRGVYPCLLPAAGATAL